MKKQINVLVMSLALVTGAPTVASAEAGPIVKFALEMAEKSNAKGLVEKLKECFKGYCSAEASRGTKVAAKLNIEQIFTKMGLGLSEQEKEIVERALLSVRIKDTPVGDLLKNQHANLTQVAKFLVEELKEMTGSAGNDAIVATKIVIRKMLEQSFSSSEGLTINQLVAIRSLANQLARLHYSELENMSYNLILSQIPHLTGEDARLAMSYVFQDLNNFQSTFLEDVKVAMLRRAHFLPEDMGVAIELFARLAQPKKSMTESLRAILAEAISKSKMSDVLPLMLRFITSRGAEGELLHPELLKQAILKDPSVLDTDLVMKAEKAYPKLAQYIDELMKAL